MKIASIDQEPIDGTDEVMTRVVMTEVASQCILARLMIKALGRPGLDNDMEIVGSGEQWEILWTQPKLTIDETRELVALAIAPPAAKIRSHS
ncbi:hypothetical protein [Microseira wollei]|uniref:Uncharacterized protein n=1 Tax=Microseira wollei NIES-4236 TaxID=2530354 RepID=A0AAV3XMJ0_9CYAN|nr:hypothetical protein [Microseira wollei]GET42891.1 hypothetical protein MiSe_77090 [Microseira wollei NIES-4236]